MNLNNIFLMAAAQAGPGMIDGGVILNGVIYFAVAVVVIFTILVLSTSILRFQHMISIEAHGEDLEDEDAFVIKMAGRIATLRSQPPPFALLLMSVRFIHPDGSEAAVESDLRDMAFRVHSFLRSSDELSVSKSGEIAFLVETNLENIRAVQGRLKERIAALGMRDPDGIEVVPDLRFGCALFPDSGEKVDTLFEAAREALVKAQASQEAGRWELAVASIPESADGSEDAAGAAEGESLPAYIDPVTGLLKSARSRSTAQKFLSQFRYDNCSASIMIVKIDGLDLLRSEYGDEVEDPVRKAVSDVMQNNLRDDDLIACWNEEAFIIGIAGDAEAAASVSKRLIGIFRQTKIEHRKYRLRFGVSIGIATYPENGRLPREILQASELAQRDAQNMGRNVFSVFEPRMLKRGREHQRGSAF